MEIDLTSAECATRTQNIFTTIYTNICTGESVSVVNGTMDVSARIGWFGFLALVCGLAVFAAAYAIKDLRK